jgi:archaellum component FlaC
MTTINTIEDLVRLLDERPEWVEALRSRILTRELLDLPALVEQRFAQVDERFNQVDARFAQVDERFNQVDERFNQVDERFNQVDARFAEMSEAITRLAENTDARFNQMSETITRLAENTDARFAEMSETIARLAENTDARFAEMSETIARLAENTDARFAEMSETIADFAKSVDRRFDKMDERLTRIMNDIGFLKGGYARSYGIRRAYDISRSMGLRRVRDMTREELSEMINANDTSGLPPGEVESFRKADLVVEAVDAQDNPCYIAVEISFTADLRDTGRAFRNAQWLEKFTGRKAYAAVAGVYRDYDINRSIESGDVAWFEIERSLLEVD